MYIRTHFEYIFKSLLTFIYNVKLCHFVYIVILKVLVRLTFMQEI